MLCKLAKEYLLELCKICNNSEESIFPIDSFPQDKKRKDNVMRGL